MLTRDLYAVANPLVFFVYHWPITGTKDEFLVVSVDIQLATRQRSGLRTTQTVKVCPQISYRYRIEDGSNVGSVV